MYRRLRAWLEKVPAPDPVRREQVVTLQILCFAGIAWCSAILLTLWREGTLGAFGFDVAVIALGTLPGLLGAIILARTGRDRAGGYAGVAAISIPVALLLTQGVEYSLPRIAFVGIGLAAAGLLLGRRALWVVFLGSSAALAIGALRDAGHLGGPGIAQRAPVPLGLFTQAVFVCFFIALVLDRLGGLLRGMLKSSLLREAELRASEERFRMLSSLGTEGVMVQADGVILDANETFARMAGVTAPSALVGLRGLEVMPFTPASRELMRERIRAGNDQLCEIELLRPDGTAWAAETSARNIVYAGRPARLVVLRDISLARALEAERARREAELRASVERFRLVFETSPDAMNLVRLSDGVYVEVNDAFSRMSGYDREEMIGRTSAERELWVDRAQRDWLIQDVLRGKAVGHVEADFRRKDGSIIHGQLSARGVTIAGTPYLLGIVRDETDRRRAAHEHEVLQAQLRQAQKLEAIGRLAGGVAHDFNNILTSILASAALLENTLPADHAGRADVQQIGTDALRAAQLTRQLLAFARREEIAPQLIRVEDRARNIEKMLKRVVGANISIVTSLEGKGWPVFVDPGQLEQVILNLAVNARDAMPAGGRLTIATRNVTVAAGDARTPVPAPGDYVLLTVSDSGHGMSPEVVAHAFEPFFSTKGDQGTGLGLATCYGIVTQAGGSIAIESEQGTGTCVRIHLPRAATVAASQHEPQVTSLDGSERVLLVEDDPGVRQLAVRSLEQLGYKVLAAGSASEAHAKLVGQAERIDCLVMDLQLPDGQGPPAATRILEGHGQVPILFVSGSPEALGAVRADGHASCAFLAKPYTPVELARELRALLDLAAPSKANPGPRAGPGT